MTRPPIPAAIRLALRKRCGFGCVMCGSPVFDYEHVDGFEVTGHDVDRMTLLCPFHHREKTAGRLPVDIVRAADAAPFNVGAKLTAGHPLYFRGAAARVLLGNAALGTKPVDGVGGEYACGIIVDGAVAVGFRFSDGHLRLDLELRDINNRTMIRIVDGELRLAVSNWDVKFEGRKLQIRSGAGQIMLEMVLNAPDEVHITAAKTYFNHVPIFAGKYAALGGLEVWEFVIADLTIENGSIVIGEPRRGYPTGMILADGRRHYGAPPPRADSFTVGPAHPTAGFAR